MKNEIKGFALAAMFLSVSFPAYAAGPDQLSEALDPSNAPAARCAAISAAAATGGEAAARGLAGLVGDADPEVRACALRAASGSGNEFAVEALLATVEAYQAAGSNKGAYEENLKEKLKAMDAIWGLGEIGHPALQPRLEKFYAQADNVQKVNLVISMGRLKKGANAGPYLYKIAADPKEAEVVRAAAFEMLELAGYQASVPGLVRSEAGIDKADLIFTGGIVGTVSGWVSPDFPIGHAGVFAGTEAKDGRINIVIADCVPNNFKPGGVRNIYSWYNFTHQYKFPFYGNRTTAVKPTAAQRERIVSLGLELGKKGLRYNDTHFMQKGPVEFDCVGYTEYLYESAGLNPTPAKLESGLGWPLTPFEQFAATRPSAPARGPAPLPGDGHNAVFGQAVLNSAFGALTGAFGMKGVQPLEIPAEIQPASVN